MSHDKILESDLESLLEKITTHVEGNDDEESTVLFKFEGDRLFHLRTFFPKIMNARITHSTRNNIESEKWKQILNVYF